MAQKAQGNKGAAPTQRVLPNQRIGQENPQTDTEDQMDKLGVPHVLGKIFFQDFEIFHDAHPPLGARG